MNRNTLIWFQHLHKCAGSTIVKLAELNGERLPENHRNGNPLDASGNHLPLWEYSEEEFNTFITDQINSGVTFIACELGGPKFKVLQEHPNVTTVTVLRDPYKRFLSAYYFTYLRHGISNQVSNFSEQNHPLNFYRQWSHTWNFENYYTRIFSEINLREDKVSDLDFNKALKNIQGFDYPILMKSKNWLAELSDNLGWKYSKEVYANKGKSNLDMMKMLVSFKFNKFLRHLITRKNYDDRYRRIVELINPYDFEIYNKLIK